MTRLLTAMILSFLLTGCATVSWFGKGGPSAWEQRRKLAQAVEHVKAGHYQIATTLLTTICREKGIPGITDEALFRLGLLLLRHGGADRDAPSATLERLRKEYPASAWTKTAAPILDLLSQYDDLRDQNKGLKSANQTLSRENRELLQNIERLKSLDLELERVPKQGK